MYLSENLQKKWEGVLDHPDLAPIKDPYRKAVTAVILENQAQEMQKASGMLYEAVPTNSASAGLGSAGAIGGGLLAGGMAGYGEYNEQLARGKSSGEAAGRGVLKGLGAGGGAWA